MSLPPTPRGCRTTPLPDRGLPPVAWRRHDHEGGRAGVGQGLDDQRQSDDRTREAANAAADEPAMPVGAWVQRALRRALEAKAEPETGPAEGGSRRAEATGATGHGRGVAAVKEALARSGTTAAPPSPADGSRPAHARAERQRRR